jgi:hypothetical protein
MGEKVGEYAYLFLSGIVVSIGALGQSERRISPKESLKA